MTAISSQSVTTLAYTAGGAVSITTSAIKLLRFWIMCFPWMILVSAAQKSLTAGSFMYRTSNVERNEGCCQVPNHSDPPNDADRCRPLPTKLTCMETR